MHLSTLTPKLIPKILESDEKILWISAARFPLQSKLVAALFGLLFSIFLYLFLTQLVFPFFQGRAPEFDGKAVTAPVIYIMTAVFSVLCLFFILTIRAQRAVRYIVTGRRAFIYQPTLGISFNYDLTEKKWKRDYAATDDERDSGPIAQGGYFTEHTQIEKTPNDPGKRLTISGLQRQKNPDRDREALVKKIPILGILPSDSKDVTIQFKELEDVDSTSVKINHIVEKFQYRLKQ